MYKNKFINIFGIFVGIIFLINGYIFMQMAHGWDQKWDQGHDGTQGDPGDGKGDCNNPPCCKEPPCDKCKSSGSPVILADGSYNALLTDIKLTGIPEIEMKRYYRSKHRYRTGYFGYGWSFAYEMRLKEVSGEQDYIIILMPNTQIYRFGDNGNGTYESPKGINMILSKKTSGQFELAENGGDTYLFDNDGKLTEIIDKNGKKVNIAYLDGCISRVFTEDGRSLNFTKGANGKIASVTDHTGRKVQYIYDENGDMTGFTNVNDHTQTYTYQAATREADQHLLISVSDFMGKIIASIGYDKEGRVTTLKENSLTYTYEYLEGNIVRKTDIDGTWEFTYNDAGEIISVKDPTDNTVSKIFDDNGNMTSETDARGKITTYTYDELGNILTITDGLKNITGFTYYPGTELVETETNPQGIVTRYEYDKNGNISKIYYASGTSEQAVVSNTYDAAGNLMSTTDPNGITASYTYDDAGRVLSIKKDNLTVFYEYDALGNLTKITYPWGKTKETTYDNEGRILTEKDPEDNIISYEYDENGNLKTVTDARKNITKYEYNTYGQLTKITDADGKYISYTLDNKGRPTSIRDRNGYTQKITYNHQGLATQITTGSFTQNFKYDANGNRIEHTDAEGNITGSEYDELNRLSKRASSLGTEAVYQYDKNGKLLSVDFAGPGISVKRSYDSLGRELTYSDSLGTINTKTYDKSGNILTETDAGGNSVVCKYDAFNRITKKTFMDGTWQTYRYNNKGVIDQITSSNGSVTDFTFDDNGRIISSTDPRGIYSVTYDEQGNVATRTDPNENTTSYEYDKMNRVIKETYPDSSVKTFTYYPEGQLKSVKDRKGNTVQYEYNELGLLTKRNFPGDNDDVFTYSGRGQVLTAANKNATVSYIYDNEGRVIQETLNGQTTSYSYDLNNKKMQITYPGGRVITEYYDVRGRLAKLSGSADGDIATFTYNLNDEPKQTDYKNGTTVAYTFANARPTGITHKLGQNSPFLGYNLTYKNGQIEKETRTDNKNRDKSYTYDVMGRLTNSVQGNRTDNYTLDGVDNWLDFNGEKRTVNKLNQYTSINSVNYQYDLNGNLTEDSNNKYEYDYMNRLTKVTGKSDAKVSEYKYDALGRRTSVTSGGVTTNYFYNLKIQVIEEQVNGAVSATYVVGNRPDIYSMNRNGKTYYYHQDIRGSVMRITDNSGKVVEEYEYDAYGNTNIYDGSGNLISVSAIGNFYGFTGAMFDSDTGLYFMINRYYSPYLGRFVSADPLGYVDGGNLYGYASLDPINYIDLLGLSSEQCSKMGFDYSLGGDLSFLLQSIKIGIKGSGSKASIKLSIEECRKECCKNGKITQSPIYIKEASLEGNWKMSEELPVPSLSFYIPVLGKIGVFATVDIYIKGSGSYKEIVNKDCEIEIGVAKACVEIGGSIGVKAGLEINISKIQGKASLSGKASPSGQVCYGKEGWEILICAGANISAEASVKITYTWWSVSKSYNWNVLTAQMCYVRNAKGSYISGTLKSDIFGEITQKQPI